MLWSTLIEVTGFPGRNRKGIEGTLVRLKDAAESDARAATHAVIRTGGAQVSRR